MTEQEKRRRRREMERRMRARAGAGRKEEARGGLTAFRIYVTAVLAGGCLLVSLFQTETSRMVCERVKETIARQTTVAELRHWKDRLAAYLEEKQLALPAMEERQEDKKVYLPDTEESP